LYIRMKRHFHALRVLIVTAVVFVGILLGSASTLADDLKSLQNQYAALQQQQQQLQQQINSQKSQLVTESQKKASIDESVELTRQQITILNTQISTLDAQIDSNTSDITATQLHIDGNYKLYNQRLRAVYEAGKDSYIDVLLSSKDFTDFLSRVELLQVISENDTNLINNLTQDENKLKADQAAMQADRGNLVNSQGTLAAKQDIVNAQLAQQSQIISQLQDNVNSTQTQSAEVDQQARQTDAEINAAIAQQAKARALQLAQQAAQQQTKGPSGQTVPSIPSGGSPVDGSYVVNYARAFLGYPYVSDTAGPNVFDCSGFTQYVFANAAGIALTHSANQQSQVGTAVTKSDLEPGDLVFFATEGGRTVSHVGIYIGNDQFIAANTSTGVATVKGFLEDPYWGKDYVCARRILN
jgi:cell wall-associated NlpC family hydrolase